MSSPDSKVNSQQPVYGNFEPPVRVMLRTTDKKRIWADRQLLVKSSSFFAGLSELPQQQDAVAKSDSPTKVLAIVPAQAAGDFQAGSPEAVTTTRSDPDKPKLDLLDPAAGQQASISPPVGIQQASFSPPIDIDANVSDLFLFYDFMYLTGKLSGFIDASSITVKLPQARILWSLADKYDCAKMIIALRHRLAALARQQPWAVLELASDIDDMDLARVAISSMTEKHLHDASKGVAVDSTMWPQLSKLRLEWQLEFLRLCLPSTNNGPVYDSGGRLTSKVYAVLDLNFHVIAQKFNPYLSKGG